MICMAFEALGSAGNELDDLTDVERAVTKVVGEFDVDLDAMHAVANVFRVESAVRNHMLRQVLVEDDLSWTGFVALWVLWVWGDQETRFLAQRCSVTRATMTGVVRTLEKRGLATRGDDPNDGRVVVVGLTETGLATISRLFPIFNSQEAFVTAALTNAERRTLAHLLRKVLRTVDTPI